MRIAILGGSFNPVHIGHAMLADTIITELGFDKVLFVPTCIPPHKIINSKVTTEQRVEMLQSFCNTEGNGHFEVELCEIERGGISYTSDTLTYLAEKYKGKIDGKFSFVMGDEVAAEFDKWHEVEVVASLADFIITRRYPDYREEGSQDFGNTPAGHYMGDFAKKFSVEEFKYPCNYLKTPVLPVSSTDIRTRVAEGKSFRYLVPAAVYDYIVKNKLYIQDK